MNVSGHDVKFVNKRLKKKLEKIGCDGVQNNKTCLEQTAKDNGLTLHQPQQSLKV